VLKIRCKKCQSSITVKDPQKVSPAPHAQAPQHANPFQQAHHTAPSYGGYGAANPFQQKSHHGPQSGAGLQSTQFDEPEHEEGTVIARVSTDWASQFQQQKPEVPVWFIAPRGEQEGPFTRTQVVEKISQGILQEKHLIWKAGWRDWQPLKKTNELKQFLQPGQQFDPLKAIQFAEQNVNEALSQLGGQPVPTELSTHEEIPQVSAPAAATLFEEQSAKSEPVFTEPSTPEPVFPEPSVSEPTPQDAFEDSLEGDFFDRDIMQPPSLNEKLSKEEIAELKELAAEEDDAFMVGDDDFEILEESATFQSKKGVWIGVAVAVVLLGAVAAFLMMKRQENQLVAGAQAETNIGKSNTSRTKKAIKYTKEQLEARCRVLGNCPSKVAMLKPSKKPRRFARRQRKRIRIRTIRTQPIKRSVSSLRGGGGVPIPAELLRGKPAKQQQIEGCPKGVDRKMCKELYMWMARKQGSVRRCYDLYLKYVVSKGRVVLTLNISQDGAVAISRVQSNMPRASKIVRCIQRSSRHWRFRSFSGTPSISLEVPFTFRPIN
tara:strand:- start:5255 stop:6892 length:1638 start_codon:yes stop_codon:yes gene_type:complete